MIAKFKTAETRKTQSTIVRLDPDLHKRLRIAAIEQRISMNEAINKAVENWLTQRKQVNRVETAKRTPRK